jgi:hypothetical protein
LLASLAIGAAFVWILHRGALPLIPDRRSFGGVRWWTVAAYLGICLVVHGLRASRWYWLLLAIHRVPFGRTLRVALIGFCAILLMPFRSGELVRPLLIRTRGELSGWAATGTVAAERIIDGLSLSVLLLLALHYAKPLEPLPDHIGKLPVPAAAVPGAARAAVAMFSAAFAAMALFHWRREWTRRLLLAALGPISPRLAHWVAERVDQTAHGFGFLTRARYSIPFALMTLAYWSMNAVGSWLLAWGSGFDSITLSQSCAVLGVLALGILLPAAPGFFGAFQISIYAGLALFFPTEQVVTEGAVYVFLIYVIQVAVTVVAALVSFLLDRETLVLAVRPDE